MPGTDRRASPDRPGADLPARHLRIVPPPPDLPPDPPRPGVHRAGIVVAAVFLLWVAVMVAAVIAGWAPLGPMLAGAVLAAVWGVAGDPHRGGDPA